MNHGCFKAKRYLDSIRVEPYPMVWEPDDKLLEGLDAAFNDAKFEELSFNDTIDRVSPFIAELVARLEEDDA